MPSFGSTNSVINHAKYQEIAALLRERIVAGGGKVNAAKFYREVIASEAPDITYKAWTHYMAKLKAIDPGFESLASPKTLSPAIAATVDISTIIADGRRATESGLNSMIHIGAKALESIIRDPALMERLPLKDRIMLLPLAMKAQDSRVHAIGRMKDDRRAEEKFNRLLNNGTYKKDGPTS